MVNALGDGTGGLCALQPADRKAQDGSTPPPGHFADENFEEKHSRAGLLSMANSGKKHTNSSQFFITLKKLPRLNGKHVVFGQIVSSEDVCENAKQKQKMCGGMQLLKAIEQQGVREDSSKGNSASSRPMKRVVIEACGQLAESRGGRKEPPLSSLSFSLSDEDEDEVVETAACKNEKTATVSASSSPLEPPEPVALRGGPSVDIDMVSE
jgi:cyclophilin family peptidyl-prolyl cis-trans isomerase